MAPADVMWSERRQTRKSPTVCSLYIKDRNRHSQPALFAAGRQDSRVTPHLECRGGTRGLPSAGGYGTGDAMTTCVLCKTSSWHTGEEISPAGLEKVSFQCEEATGQGLGS